MGEAPIALSEWAMIDFQEIAKEKMLMKTSAETQIEDRQSSFSEPAQSFVFAFHHAN